MDHPVDLPPLDIPEIMRQHGLQANRRLGQNFLVDEAALHKVVQAAEITPQNVVLEIGAGLGNLTRYLAVLARLVVAVELDGRLIPVLRQVLEPYPQVRILQGDILTMNPAELFSGLAVPQDYLVVANIPYYITSAVIRHLLEASLRPKRLVLTVQREVAERICASPGEMSLLALSVQVYGQPEIAGRIPAGAFYPVPEVDSAIVRVNLRSEPALPARQLESFFRLARAGFSQKRKTLRNALAGGLACKPTQAQALLEAAGIDSLRRAETLSIEEWGRLTTAWEAVQGLGST